MRQLQILFNQTKTWHGIVCWFSWIYLFLPRTDKNRSNVKFWFDWIKFGAVSYWLSCIVLTNIRFVSQPSASKYLLNSKIEGKTKKFRLPIYFIYFFDICRECNFNDWWVLRHCTGECNKYFFVCKTSPFLTTKTALLTIHSSLVDYLVQVI